MIHVIVKANLREVSCQLDEICSSQQAFTTANSFHATAANHCLTSVDKDMFSAFFIFQE
jgi:hypothetical protein